MITNLAIKASMLTIQMVSTVVALRWDWYDPELNCWVIPFSTKGLKRSMKTMNEE